MYLPSSLSLINILEPEIEPAYEKSSIKSSVLLKEENTVSPDHLCEEPTVNAVVDCESECAESVDHIENFKYNSFIEREHQKLMHGDQDYMRWGYKLLKSLGIKEKEKIIIFWKSIPDEEFKMFGIKTLAKVGIKPKKMGMFWREAPDGDFKKWGIEWMKSLNINYKNMPIMWGRV